MQTYDCISDKECFDHLHRAFRAYKRMLEDDREGLRVRLEMFTKMKSLLKERKEGLARIITEEMGKPIS